MRARRLAKLGGGSSASPAPGSSESTGSAAEQTGAPAPNPAASPAASPSATPTPTKITITPRPKPAQEASGKHEDPRSGGREASPAKRQRVAVAAATPANTPTEAPQPRPASAAKPSTPTPTPVDAAEALAEWTSATISLVLHVTVVPDQTQDRHGTALTFLKDLRAEIQERAGGDGSSPLRLAVDDIDPALLEACTALPHTKPLLDYLLPAYKAVGKLLKSRIAVPQRLPVLQEIKRLCMSNIVFALTMPEYFGCVVRPARCPVAHCLSDRSLTRRRPPDATPTPSTTP